MVAPAAARPQGTGPVVPATPARPEPSTDRPVAVPSLQHVLAAPDHILYVTSNSELVIEHPRSEELLEMVDRSNFLLLWEHIMDAAGLLRQAGEMQRRMESAAKTHAA